MPIRARLTALFICLLLLYPFGSARAKGTLDVIPQAGLLLLEDFQQWFGVNYQYGGHSSNVSNGSYSTNRLEELYHVQTGIAIYNPHLLNLGLSGEVGYEQLRNSSDASGSSKGSGARYQYSLDASALDRSWHPFTVFSSRVLETVVSPFSPTYDTVTVRNGIEALFLAAPFTSKFRYETNSLDLSGAGIHTNTASDSFQGSVGHDFRDINFLTVNFALSASTSTGNGSDQRSHGNSLGISDMLYWGKLRQYSLLSEYQSARTSTSGLPQESVSWNETLQGRLGKALDTELDYRYTSNRTAIPDGPEQFYATNSLTAQIQHHLFQSLDTRLNATVSQSQLPGGTENRYTELVGVVYRKILPANSALKVNVFGQHDVTDHKGSATQLFVINEVHSVTQVDDIVLLKNSGPVQAGSVTVAGFLVPPANPQVPPDKTYTENIDFTVDYSTGRILWKGFPPAVPNIVVSYTSLIDPSVNYSTDTLSLDSSLSLNSGRYVLGFFYFDQSRVLNSGVSQNGLFDTRIATLRMQKFQDRQNYSLEYSNYVSGPTKYQYVEGGWQYSRQEYSSSLQVQAKERYTLYDAVANANGYSANTINTSTTYTRNVFDTALLLFSVNLIDERGDRIAASDNIFFRSSLRARFNKLTVTAVGSTGWRISGGSRSRDDNVRLEILRSF